MKKRFLTISLALVLCMGLAVPAFASDDTDGVTFSYDVSGTFTISEGADSITFSAAKVERTVLQRREYISPAPAHYTAYKTESVAVVTIRPDTRITVANENGYSFDIVRMDGSNQFTTYFYGSEKGVHIVNGVGVDAFINMPQNANSLSSYAICELGYAANTYYILVMEPGSPAFTDVKLGDFFANAVNWAVEQNITNGTSDTTFSPARNCTQAEILTFLWRAAGKPEEGSKTPVANVNEDDYFYQAVMWANDMGMIDPGTFDPGKPCTRSQAVLYICRAFAVPYQSPVDSGFSDVAADAPYAYAVAWAVENGITDGTDKEAGLFSPDQTCTRGHIVTFLRRAYVEEARLPVAK